MGDEAPAPKPRKRMPVERSSGRGGSRQTKASIERDARAMELRSQGWTLQAIDKELGFGGHGNVVAAINRWIARTVQEPADNVRAFLLNRLDAATNVAMVAMNGFYPMLHQGEPVTVPGDDGKPVQLRDWRPNLAAADRVERLTERTAKLLGVDAPERHEINVTSEADTAVAAMLRDVQDYNQQILNRIRGQQAEDEDT
jgi:hypothetical protein